MGDGRPAGPPPVPAAARLLPGSLAGAVLAGGAGSRLGRDKALVELGGRTLVERAIAALDEAGAGPVAVVGGDADALARLGLTVVADGWPGRGPLGGVLTAFGWSPAPLVAIVACDLPFVDGEVIHRLAGELTQGEPGGGPDAAVARTDRLEPMCAVWRIERCEATLLAAFTAGERAVHRAIAGLTVREVEIEPDQLLNVNTPAELALAQARSAAGGRSVAPHADP